MNFSRFRAAAHVSRVKCAEMAGDRVIDRDNLYKITTSVSFNPLGSRWFAHAGVKEWCSPKSGYFTAIGWSQCIAR